MHTTAAHRLLHIMSRQPLLEGTWGQVPLPSAGSWSRETGCDRQPLAAFSFPLWDSGFGESQVAYLLCAVATPSCVPFGLPVTLQDAGPWGVPLVRVCFPAGRGLPPSCGQGRWFVESLGELENFPVGRPVPASASSGAPVSCPTLKPESLAPASSCVSDRVTASL